MQLVLLRIFCSQAQGCVCSALQLVIDVEQPWLMRKYDVIDKNRKCITYHYAARGGPRHAQKNFGEDRTCTSEDMIADRKKHGERERDRQTRSSQYCAALSGAE